MKVRVILSAVIVLLVTTHSILASDNNEKASGTIIYSGEVSPLSSLIIKVTDNDTVLQRTPPCISMLPEDIKSSVMRCPEWIRENLSKKFVEMSLKNIVISNDDNPSQVYPVFADLNKDALPELVIGSENDIIKIYENIGFPLYLVEKEKINVSEISLGRISPPFSPAVGNLDSDDDLEMIVGCREGTLAILEHNQDIWVYKEIPRIDVGSYSSPTLCDIDSDGDLDLVVGARDGKIRCYENDGNGNFRMTSIQAAFSTIVVAEYSNPYLADLDDDGDYDLTVGDGSSIIHYFRNIGNNKTPIFAADDVSMYAGINTGRYNRPILYELNGDMKIDLVVGSNDGKCHYFRNFGTAEKPKWEIWPFYEYALALGYYEKENIIKYLDFDRAKEYAEILLKTDKKYVDEIGFSVAHTSAYVLNNPMVYPEVYEVNAKFIYENSLYLQYVDILEHKNYTTTRYYVNDSGEIKSFELPMEIYYWYIVHPKITDEIPTFIDPNQPSNSENATAPPPRGKFWRDYLFNHADDEYPPDPDTDRDGDGNPDFHYPKDAKPPLLREVLKDVKTLWNCTSYRAPAGYKNDGYNNSRPFTYGDHAIEKVSNWVEKTLPLNEQESGDGERPIQPVRIAHHHNGNCGELQDLTIAAARTALIPTAGVGMWGEDHVWSEFFERGWHQWDNYWSDGGSVIDDFGNYWYGWGDRGGSGIYKWRGDDFIFQVTSQYLPEDVQSYVKIKVVDRRGNPVDGARVLMMSHWLSEHAMQQTYVTVPFPSIWNYTNESGECEFIVAKNNFTIKIISKLGSATLNKTYIGVGKYYQFSFTLPGEKPYSSMEYNAPTGEKGKGMNIHISADVGYGIQYPPNPVVGGRHPQNVLLSSEKSIYVLNESEYINYQKGYIFTPFFIINTSTSITINLPPGEWYIVMPNLKMLETFIEVSISISGEVFYKKPKITIKYPDYGCIHPQGKKLHISGDYSSENVIKQISIYVDGDISGYAVIEDSTWYYDLDTFNIPGGTHTIKAEISDITGMTASDFIKIEIDDESPMIKITSPEQGSTYQIGDDITIKGFVKDNYGVKSVKIYDDVIIPKELNISPTGEWNFTIHTYGMKPGELKLIVECIDISGFTSDEELIVYLVDHKPPELEIIEPSIGYVVYDYGKTVILRGTVSDESSVYLSITMPFGTLNLTDRINNGKWSYTFHTSVLGVGEHAVYITATDSSGNSKKILIVMCIKDEESPNVQIISPSDNTTYILGTMINITGKVSDNSKIKRVEMKVGFGGWKDITDTVINDEFNILYNTSVLAPGDWNIKIRATDIAGNKAIDEVKIIIEEKKEKSEGEEEELPYLSPAIFLLMMLIICVLRRKS